MYPGNARVENVEGGVQFSSPAEGWKFGVLVSDTEGRSLDTIVDDLGNFFEDTSGYENVEIDDGVPPVSGQPAIMISYGDEATWHSSVFLIGNNGRLYEIQTESNTANNSPPRFDISGNMVGSFRLL